MKNLKPALGASVLALIVSAPAAWADVSAKDVWAQWQDYAQRSGLTIVAAGESTSGATTTYQGVTMAMESEDVGYSAAVGDVALTENADGTVSITTADSYPVTLSFGGDEPVEAKLQVSQAGLVMKASGTPEAINYGYVADSFSIELLGVSGADAEDVSATGVLKLGKTEGSSSFGAGEVQPFSSDFNSASLDLTLAVEAPEQDGNFAMTLTAADVVGTSEGALPRGIDPEDLSALLAAGMQASGNLRFGAMSYSIDFADGSDAVMASSTLESGAVDFDLSAAGIRYLTEGKGIGLTLSSSDLPVESVSLKLAESAFGFGMPISKSDTPQDFSFLTRIIGLELDEALLSMFDPSEQLPRTPINVVLDLAGKANWLIDIMAPDAEMGMAEVEMPGQLHALDVRELELTIAGASLTGTGAFTFDNENLETWGGAPAPDGKLDLKLVGANKLVDTLVAMGFVPQDQAMMAKMSMGMFAKPGDGPDTLVSTIEVKADGSVFANGQQLQ